MTPKITRGYSGTMKDARKAMEADWRKLYAEGYRLTAEEWQPKDAAKQSKPSKHKSHGILWKMTHPVGATLGAARFVGATTIAGTAAVARAAVPLTERGTLTATFELQEPAPQG